MWKFEDIFIDDTRNVERVSVKEYLENGKIAIIDQGKEKIIGYTNCEDYKVCKEERIIFGDHTRTFKYINIPFITGADGTKVLKLKDLSKYHYKYFYYYLLHSYIPDTGYNRHFKWVKELCFDIPELKEQIEIATKLDKIQDIIDVRKKQIEELDEVIKSQFVEMFGTKEDGFKCSKTEFNNCVKNMLKGPFGSDIKKSLYVPKSSDTYKVYIQINAINKNQTLGDYWISKEYFDSKMFKFELKPKDYITTCDGTLGKLLRLDENMEKGIISASLLRITLDESVITPEYFENVWSLFMLDEMRKDIRNACLTHLPSAKVIGKIEIPLPKIEKQKEFSNIVKLINKQKFEIQKSLEEIQKLQGSLMNKYFGGE